MSSGSYRPVPLEEGGADEVPLAERQSEPEQTGVEATVSWQTMSGRQKGFVYAVFGFLGAGVLLPL